VPDAREPSTGLKADKTAKTANAIVTLMMDVTVLTVGAFLVPVLGGDGVVGVCERWNAASR
jgi:hypothetical protein